MAKNTNTHMKRTNKSACGTSFHFDTIWTTPAKLKALCEILGTELHDFNTGEDKVNFECELETVDGDVFTVYDYKSDRPLKMNEQVEFHIGGHNPQVAAQAKNELLIMLTSK